MHKIADVYRKMTVWLTALLSIEAFVLLWLRLWVADIFYASGRTKAGASFLEINDIQGDLFADEYGIRFIDPELAAQAALYAETFLPLMLIVGLGARFAALGLIGMTLFIQIFVYPHLFAEHFLWLSALLAILFKGAGTVSLDGFLVKK